MDSALKNQSDIKMRIEKVIHLIWIGPNPEPKWCVDSWVQFQNLYPDYTICRWDEDLIDSFGLVNRKQYDSAPDYAGKADIARYEILYRHGGIYIDMDIEWLAHNFDSIIDKTANANKEMFMAYETNNSRLVANSLIGSVPGSKVLGKIIEELPRQYSGQNSVNESGPQFITPFVDGSVYMCDSTLFYPFGWGECVLRVTNDRIRKEYPHAICRQWGYTTNSLWNKLL